MTSKEHIQINFAAEEYAHRALEQGTPFIRHRNDFIYGVLSDAAREYWYKKFKEALGDMVNKL